MEEYGAEAAEGEGGVSGSRREQKAERRETVEQTKRKRSRERGSAGEDGPIAAPRPHFKRLTIKQDILSCY